MLCADPAAVGRPIPRHVRLVAEEWKPLIMMSRQRSIVDGLQSRYTNERRNPPRQFQQNRRSLTSRSCCRNRHLP